MNCPHCQQPMLLQSEDTSINPDNKHHYKRRVFWCKVDDVWIQIEEPTGIKANLSESGL